MSRKRREYLQTIKGRKDNGMCQILRRNFLLVRVIEEKIEERLKVTRRRSQLLLYDLQKKRGYCKLKQGALDRTLCGGLAFEEAVKFS